MVERMNMGGHLMSQIQKEYEGKDKRMAHYLTLVEDRLGKLDEWAVRCVL